VTTRRIAGLALGAAFAFAACSAPAETPARSCEEVEAVGYPAMEAQAMEVLRHVDYRLERVGACADTGSPSTVLYAYVEAWPTREVADQYFMIRGWTREDDGVFVSPNRAYRVHTTTSHVPDSPDSFVRVSFYETADRN
jgi:hypothetical protein